MKSNPELSKRLIIRDDDKPEVVSKRLQAYREYIGATADFYQKQQKLIRIPGNAPPDIVWAHVKRELNTVFASPNTQPSKQSS